VFQALAGVSWGVASCGAMTMSTMRILGSAGLWLAVACGGAPAEEPKKQAAPEPAIPKEPEDAGVAKRKADREAKAAAAKQAEADAAKKIDEIAVLPAKLPKKLDKACEEVNAAFDGFMKRASSDASSWDTKKGTQLGMMKKTCMGATIEVAACQANALAVATPELLKEIPQILGKCIEKFSKKPAG
jgi:hypothetical protein